MVKSLVNVLVLVACVLVSFAGVATVNAGTFLAVTTVDWLVWGVACLVAAVLLTGVAEQAK